MLRLGAKENEDKLSLLEQELDEASASFLEESLNAWKEATANSLMEEFEQVKAEKLEELEEENLAYREELKQEYADKLLEALEELKESVRAEITASILQNNPEIKILEQIKEVIAPVIQEDYREGIYEDSILTLQAENEQLKRQIELTEGAKTLASLVAGYDAPVRNLIVSLIKEGSPDEVSNQFYEILESLENTFGEGDEEDDDEGDEEEGGSKKKGKKKDGSDDDAEDDDDDEDDDADDDDEDIGESESYLDLGIDGLTEETKGTNKLREAIKDLSQ